MPASSISLVVFLFLFALAVVGIPFCGILAAIAAVVTGILLLLRK